MPWRKETGHNHFLKSKIFFGKKQMQSLIFSKNCEMNNFLAKVKIVAINLLGRINVKYFVQT